LSYHIFQKAYKEWVCSLTLPYYLDGFYIKPCRTFCEKVEQKCPHLHSAQTYAGEPVFICIGKLSSRGNKSPADS